MDQSKSQRAAPKDVQIKAAKTPKTVKERKPRKKKKSPVSTRTFDVEVIPAKKLFPKETKEKTKCRVAAYCRVSTDEEEQESSFELQVEHYTKYNLCCFIMHLIVRQMGIIIKLLVGTRWETDYEHLLLPTSTARPVRWKRSSASLQSMLEAHPNYRIVCLDKLTYAGNISTLKSVMDKRRRSVRAAFSPVLCCRLPMPYSCRRSPAPGPQ